MPGFINKFGTSVLAVEESFPERIKRKINHFIKSVRPTVTYDALTGTPVFSFHLENENAGLHTLEDIPADEYAQFIRQQFEKGSFVVFEEAIMEIMTLTRRHTYYVQFLCNRLYGMGMKEISKETVRQVYAEILHENEVYYSEYRNLLTRHQWNLMIALANEEGISKITSSVFIKKYDLSNTATVRRGIQSLLDKKMIYKKEMKYYVYDVFFARWLQRL